MSENIFKREINYYLADDNKKELLIFKADFDYSKLEKRLKDEYYVINKIFNLDLTVDIL